eukprot:TRINITY_DN10765_c0_g1_i2.p1 TRINITY_DN10765_c0_g1~~TRINITY_DN10765_c0_g1_i2.p1  ORF type:complete len:867 (+),score=176.54 TRINITY_DN10765_c0_g1_i2:158-2758(+)
MGQSQSDTGLLRHVDQDVAIDAPYFGPILRLSHQDREKQTWNLTALVISRLSNDTKPILSATNAIVGEAELVHQYRVWNYWRIPISFQQHRLEARYDMNVCIGNCSKQFSCVVPPIDTAPTIMYFSYNRSAKEHDPLLWQYALRQHHGGKPYHLLLGGGDQLYYDHVLALPSMAEWRKKSREQRVHPHAWTDQMRDEVEAFYMNHYLREFSEIACRPFAEAMSNIPCLFQLDDHDMFDGSDSYGEELQSCAVLQGIRGQAIKAYFLYQQHNMHNTDMWGTIGRCFLKPLGPYAILGVDSRLEHSRHHVVLPATWDLIFEKLEHLPSHVHHLLVMLSVPIVYDESHYTGDAEALDDVTHQRRSQVHHAERYAVIKRFQQFAAHFNKRVTFLGGDVHSGGIGEIYRVACEPYIVRKFEADTDVVHMTQIITSAIGSAYPPRSVVPRFGRGGSKAEYLDQATRANLVPMTAIQGGTDKHGTCLYGRRNYVQLFPEGVGIRVELVQETRHTARDGSVKIYAKSILAPPGTAVDTIHHTEAIQEVVSSAPIQNVPIASEEEFKPIETKREDVEVPQSLEEPVVAIGPSVDSDEPLKESEVTAQQLDEDKADEAADEPNENALMTEEIVSPEVLHEPADNSPENIDGAMSTPSATELTSEQVVTSPFVNPDVQPVVTSPDDAESLVMSKPEIIDEATPIAGLSMPVGGPYNDHFQPYASPEVIRSDLNFEQSPEAIRVEELTVRTDSDVPKVLATEHRDQSDLGEVPETPVETTITPFMESFWRSPVQTETRSAEQQVNSPALSTASMQSTEQIGDVTAPAVNKAPNVPPRKHFHVKLIPKPHLLGPRSDSGIVEASARGSVSDLRRKFERV